MLVGTSEHIAVLECFLPCSMLHCVDGFSCPKPTQGLQFLWEGEVCFNHATRRATHICASLDLHTSPNSATLHWRVQAGMRCICRANDDAVCIGKYVFRKLLGPQFWVAHQLQVLLHAVYATRRLQVTHMPKANERYLRYAVKLHPNASVNPSMTPHVSSLKSSAAQSS